MKGCFDYKFIQTTRRSLLLQLGVLILLVGCDWENFPEFGVIDFNSFGVTSDTDISADKYSIAERMESYNVPGVSIAVVVNGELEWAKGFGIANSITGTQVETNTLFQAASISKPISALGVLNLFEESKVDLDENVNVYLKDWKVPNNRFTSEEKVTLRRLLTHTAGITISGFPGYRQQDIFPEINDVLNGADSNLKCII